MVLPYQDLKKLIFGEQPMILANTPIEERQIQPASLDCRIGTAVYRMKFSGLPCGLRGGEETVKSFIESNSMYAAQLRPGESFVLERNVCYIIPLEERLMLWDKFYAAFSPKSSIGRCDIFVRVITDKFARYDSTRKGYHGLLYLEVIPLSFSARIIAGISLVQLRIQEHSETLGDSDLALMHAEFGVLRHANGHPLSSQEMEIEQNSILLHLDLSRDIVGFEALDTSIESVYLHAEHAHEVLEFWRPIRKEGRYIVLKEGKFYLLATKEYVKMPPSCCAELMAYRTGQGEFRVHYAGFFDPGFGGEHGTAGVLEMRAHHTPVRLFDGQALCAMQFQRMDSTPEKLYGEEKKSNYTAIGPSLSKHFLHREMVWQ